MNWSDFYLICFLVGFGLSVVALLAGSVHVHMPHLHVHHGIHLGRGGLGGRGTDLSWFNFGTIAAFLAWFGGAGYLFFHYYSAWLIAALGIGVIAGLIGASIVFFFLARVLMQKEEVLDPDDYDMIGVLGTVTSGIRPSGTGEMIFSQAGVRRGAAARSEDGSAIDKGAEVVVTRYERGIAYVRLWEELEKSTATKEGA